MTATAFIPFPGTRVRDVEIFSHRVDIYISPRHDEIQRRETRGLGAICNPSAIRTLDALPSGIRLPATLLDALDHLSLTTLAPGAIQSNEKTIERLAIAPVRVNGITRAVERWDEAASLSLLRTHAPRIAVTTDRRVADRVWRGIDDSDLGVAVVTDTTSVLVRSPGSAAVRHSWQRWLLAELSYAAWCRETQSNALRHA